MKFNFCLSEFPGKFLTNVLYMLFLLYVLYMKELQPADVENEILL